MSGDSRQLPRRSKRVRFMGAVNGQLWWDVKTRNGWLVVKAGRWRKGRSGNRFAWPRVYWSPNATPWHHDARNVFRAKRVECEECVCEVCHAS